MFDYLQKFNDLPENLRNSVSSEAAMSVISSLEKEYKIDLASTVMKVMIKSLPLADLPTYFVSDFSLNPEDAKKLTADLKEKLFFMVSNYLGYNPSYSSIIPKMTPVSNLKTENNPENTYYLEADKIIKNSGIIFASSELNIRLKNVLLTYLKGVRSRVDIRLTLSKDILSGGLGLSHQVIDKIFKLGDGFILNKSQNRITPPIQPRKEINKEALEKVRQVYEKHEPLQEIPYNIQDTIKNKQIKAARVNLNLPLNEDNLRLSAPKIANKKLLEAPERNGLLTVNNLNKAIKQVSQVAPVAVLPQNNQVVKNNIPDVNNSLKINLPLNVEQGKETGPKINRPPEKKPNVITRILKPVDNSKEDIVKQIALVEKDGKQESIISKRNEAVLKSEVNNPKLFSVEREQLPKTQPLISDIQPPKTMGPLDELRYLDITNFRRMGSSPAEVIAKIETKIRLLEKGGYDNMISGVLAWRDSLVNSLYLKMGQEALLKEITFKQCADSYQKAKANNFLFWEEIEAIITLNSRLMF